MDANKRYSREHRSREVMKSTKSYPYASHKDDSDTEIDSENMMNDSDTDIERNDFTSPTNSNSSSRPEKSETKDNADENFLSLLPYIKEEIDSQNFDACAYYSQENANPGTSTFTPEAPKNRRLRMKIRRKYSSSSKVHHEVIYLDDDDEEESSQPIDNTQKVCSSEETSNLTSKKNNSSKWQSDGFGDKKKKKKRKHKEKKTKSKRKEKKRHNKHGTRVTSPDTSEVVFNEESLDANHSNPDLYGSIPTFFNSGLSWSTVSDYGTTRQITSRNAPSSFCSPIVNIKSEHSGTTDNSAFIYPPMPHLIPSLKNPQLPGMFQNSSQNNGVLSCSNTMPDFNNMMVDAPYGLEMRDVVPDNRDSMSKGCEKNVVTPIETKMNSFQQNVSNSTPMSDFGKIRSEIPAEQDMNSSQRNVTPGSTNPMPYFSETQGYFPNEQNSFQKNFEPGSRDPISKFMKKNVVTPNEQEMNFANENASSIPMPNFWKRCLESAIEQEMNSTPINVPPGTSNPMSSFSERRVDVPNEQSSFQESVEPSSRNAMSKLWKKNAAFSNEQEMIPLRKNAGSINPMLNSWNRNVDIPTEQGMISTQINAAPGSSNPMSYYSERKLDVPSEQKNFQPGKRDPMEKFWKKNVVTANEQEMKNVSCISMSNSRKSNVNIPIKQEMNSPQTYVEPGSSTSMSYLCEKRVDIPNEHKNFEPGKRGPMEKFWKKNVLTANEQEMNSCQKNVSFIPMSNSGKSNVDIPIKQEMNSIQTNVVPGSSNPMSYLCEKIVDIPNEQKNFEPGKRDPMEKFWKKKVVTVNEQEMISCQKNISCSPMSNFQKKNVDIPTEQELHSNQKNVAPSSSNLTLHFSETKTNAPNEQKNVEPCSSNPKTIFKKRYVYISNKQEMISCQKNVSCSPMSNFQKKNAYIPTEQEPNSSLKNVAPSSSKSVSYSAMSKFQKKDVDIPTEQELNSTQKNVAPSSSKSVSYSAMSKFQKKNVDIPTEQEPNSTQKNVAPSSSKNVSYTAMSIFQKKNVDIPTEQEPEKLIFQNSSQTDFASGSSYPVSNFNHSKVDSSIEQTSFPRNFALGGSNPKLKCRKRKADTIDKQEINLFQKHASLGSSNSMLNFQESGVVILHKQETKNVKPCSSNSMCNFQNRNVDTPNKQHKNYFQQNVEPCCSNSMLNLRKRKMDHPSKQEVVPHYDEHNYSCFSNQTENFCGVIPRNSKVNSAYPESDDDLYENPSTHAQGKSGSHASTAKANQVMPLNSKDNSDYSESDDDLYEIPSTHAQDKCGSYDSTAKAHQVSQHHVESNISGHVSIEEVYRLSSVPSKDDSDDSDDEHSYTFLPVKLQDNSSANASTEEIPLHLQENSGAPVSIQGYFCKMPRGQKNKRRVPNSGQTSFKMPRGQKNKRRVPNSGQASFKIRSPHPQNDANVMNPDGEAAAHGSQEWEAFQRDASTTTTDHAEIIDDPGDGPIPEGTKILLQGVVWKELESGILVVNVNFRKRIYCGTLMDSSKHHWQPATRRFPNQDVNPRRLTRSSQKINVFYYEGFTTEIYPKVNLNKKLELKDLLYFFSIFKVEEGCGKSNASQKKFVSNLQVVDSSSQSSIFSGSNMSLSMAFKLIFIVLLTFFWNDRKNSDEQKETSFRKKTQRRKSASLPTVDSDKTEGNHEVIGSSSEKEGIDEENMPKENCSLASKTINLSFTIDKNSTSADKTCRVSGMMDIRKLDDSDAEEKDVGTECSSLVKKSNDCKLNSLEADSETYVIDISENINCNRANEESNDSIEEGNGTLHNTLNPPHKIAVMLKVTNKTSGSNVMEKSKANGSHGEDNDEDDDKQNDSLLRRTKDCDSSSAFSRIQRNENFNERHREKGSDLLLKSCSTFTLIANATCTSTGEVSEGNTIDIINIDLQHTNEENESIQIECNSQFKNSLDYKLNSSSTMASLSNIIETIDTIDCNRVKKEIDSENEEEDNDTFLNDALNPPFIVDAKSIVSGEASSDSMMDISNVHEFHIEKGENYESMEFEYSSFFRKSPDLNSTSSVSSQNNIIINSPEMFSCNQKDQRGDKSDEEETGVFTNNNLCPMVTVTDKRGGTDKASVNNMIDTDKDIHYVHKDMQNEHISKFGKPPNFNFEPQNNMINTNRKMSHNHEDKEINDFYPLVTVAVKLVNTNEANVDNSMDLSKSLHDVNDEENEYVKNELNSQFEKSATFNLDPQNTMLNTNQTIGCKRMKAGNKNEENNSSLKVFSTLFTVPVKSTVTNESSHSKSMDICKVDSPHGKNDPDENTLNKNVLQFDEYDIRRGKIDKFKRNYMNRTTPSKPPDDALFKVPIPISNAPITSKLDFSCHTTFHATENSTLPKPVKYNEPPKLIPSSGALSLRNQKPRNARVENSRDVSSIPGHFSEVIRVSSNPKDISESVEIYPCVEVVQDPVPFSTICRELNIPDESSSMVFPVRTLNEHYQSPTYSDITMVRDLSVKKIKNEFGITSPDVDQPVFNVNCNTQPPYQHNIQTSTRQYRSPTYSDIDIVQDLSVKKIKNEFGNSSPDVDQPVFNVNCNTQPPYQRNIQASTGQYQSPTYSDITIVQDFSVKRIKEEFGNSSPKTDQSVSNMNCSTLPYQPNIQPYQPNIQPSSVFEVYEAKPDLDKVKALSNVIKQENSDPNSVNQVYYNYKKRLLFHLDSDDSIKKEKPVENSDTVLKNSCAWDFQVPKEIKAEKCHTYFSTACHLLKDSPNSIELLQSTSLKSDSCQQKNRNCLKKKDFYQSKQRDSTQYSMSELCHQNTNQNSTHHSLTVLKNENYATNNFHEPKQCMQQTISHPSSYELQRQNVNGNDSHETLSHLTNHRRQNILNSNRATVIQRKDDFIEDSNNNQLEEISLPSFNNANEIHGVISSVINRAVAGNSALLSEKKIRRNTNDVKLLSNESEIKMKPYSLDVLHKYYSSIMRPMYLQDEQIKDLCQNNAYVNPYVSFATHGNETITNNYVNPMTSHSQPSHYSSGSHPATTPEELDSLESCPTVSYSTSPVVNLDKDLTNFWDPSRIANLNEREFEQKEKSATYNRSSRGSARKNIKRSNKSKMNRKSKKEGLKSTAESTISKPNQTISYAGKTMFVWPPLYTALTPYEVGQMDSTLIHSDPVDPISRYPTYSSTNIDVNSNSLTQAIHLTPEESLEM